MDSVATVATAVFLGELGERHVPVQCNGPQVLLLDEPCSSLDPKAAAKIEQLIRELARKFTIILVTHNLRQAARCAHFVAFFHQGRLIEHGRGDEIFVSPGKPQTREYFQGTAW